MLTLLLHTAGADGWVTLARIAPDTARAELLAEEQLPGRGSSEAILPAVRAVFARAGCLPGELGAVVVVAGPGSFTGVRVGMAAAKGLCDATGARLLAVSRLHLLASAARSLGMELLVLLDAGRGEFYGGVSRSMEGLEGWQERLMTREEVEAAMPGRVAVTSEPQVREALGPAVQSFEEPDARALLRLALPLIERGEWTDVAAADALYLRRTDAENKAGAA